jgi:hypothetical protein
MSFWALFFIHHTYLGDDGYDIPSQFAGWRRSLVSARGIYNIVFNKIMKNLVKKYLGQDLRSMIMANPNRVYNETSVLIDILNNQLLPKLLNDPNYKIPYKNLQPEIKNLGYNARYVFVMTCDGVYTDGNGMNPNQSNIKAWAQTGTN